MKVPFSSLRIRDKRLRIVLGDRGSGKTNFALALAERLRPYVDGVDFVIPASVKPTELDDDLVVRPLGKASEWKRYVSGLRDRVVIVDEGLIAVNARNRYSGFGTTLAKLSAVSRHVNVYVIVTSQAHLVDRLLRTLADAVVVKRTSISRLVVEDSPPRWIRKIDDALRERSRGTISLSTMPLDEAVVVADHAYYVTDIPLSKWTRTLSTRAKRHGIVLRHRGTVAKRLKYDDDILHRMIEGRFKKLRKAYVKRSRMKYGNRRPLNDHGIVTVYAHYLDGCPIRAVFEATTSLPRIRKASFDRGDSFEVGFGTVHGLPSGLEVAVDVTDLVSDIVPKGTKVYLHGTPDFVLIEDGKLIVLDAKSPARRKPDDGLKGYRRTRMETYAFILRRYWEAYSESGAVRFALNGIRMPHPKNYVIESANATPRPVAKERIGERENGDVETYVVVASTETGTYHELYVPSDDDSVIERLRYFVTAIFDPEAVVDYVRSLHEDDERKRECRYCPRTKCPFATSETKVFELAILHVDGNRLSAEHVYELVKDEDGKRKREVRSHDFYEFEIRDRDLLEYARTKSYTTIVVKARKVRNGRIRDRYRIYRWIPKTLYDYE